MSESWQESMIKFLTRDDGTFDRDRLQMLADDLKTEAEEGYARTIEQTRTPEQELELAQKRGEINEGFGQRASERLLKQGAEVQKANTDAYGQRVGMLGSEQRKSTGQLIDYRKETGDQFNTTHNKLLDLEYQARDKDRNLATMGLLANAVPSVMAALTLFG